jgi:hypothetical protein
MAFAKSGWRNGGNESVAPAIHSYTTPDAAAAVNTADYFNAVAGEIKVGDLIYAVTGNAGTIVPMLYPVRAITGTFPTQSVDVSDGLAVTMTNTD